MLVSCGLFLHPHAHYALLRERDAQRLARSQLDGTRSRGLVDRGCTQLNCFSEAWAWILLWLAAPLYSLGCRLECGVVNIWPSCQHSRSCIVWQPAAQVWVLISRSVLLQQKLTPGIFSVRSLQRVRLLRELLQERVHTHRMQSSTRSSHDERDCWATRAQLPRLCLPTEQHAAARP